MDTALTPVTPTNLAAQEAAAPTTALGRLAALPARAKLMASVGVAGLVAIVVALALWSNQGDWKVLLSNLSDKESGAIVGQLAQMNVPYKFEAGGAVILVPTDRVAEVKGKLAMAGALPKVSNPGFELMDNAKFGQTQFNERVTFQRSLQGELERIITTMTGAQKASVLLALPQQNGFFREQQKPTASVTLTLHPGRTLDRAQIAGIVHLVSSSVPELSPKAVSVVDQSGLLTNNGREEGALDAQQLQYVQQIEQSYLKRVIEILEPVVGRDNLRATVTADVDFSQSEQTSEAYKPNQGNEPAAVRSQQNLESTQPGNPTPTGVPGAQSNQPPQPAAAPLQGASAPLQAAQGGNNGGGSRKENVINYEVDRTTRVVRGATGTVRRINAAVVLNHRNVTDAKGKTTQQPLPAEEVEKLTQLVQEAIGFSKDRGDSVKVINTPFRAEPKGDAAEPPLWKQPWVHDLLRSAAVPTALTLVALLLVFGVIRPALKPPAPPEAEKKDDSAAAATGANLDEVVGGAEALPNPDATPALEAPGIDQRLADARSMARQNPAAVAEILRGWVAGEET